ncbi:MAG: histidinol-phosphatase HisJ family protein [Clostridia bacterium]|nr:histidinol-phosphatase HisJ family protein [Clostridia bacterium]
MPAPVNRLTDLHVHSRYSDGADIPEDIIVSAIKLGVKTLGFSDHSFTEFDTSYCMKKEKTAEYVSEIRSLAEKYSGEICVLCGIEQDLFSGQPDGGYDYVIGSVHYFRLGDEYIPVDLNAKTLLYAAEKYFGGDMISLAEEYYRSVSRLGRMSPDIIGHIDLITKFNEGGALFDEGDPRYVVASRRAVDEILSDRPGQVFEINTGAMSRGYRKTPYPSPALAGYIRSGGGRFILSSDSHRKETLCFGFDTLKNAI